MKFLMMTYANSNNTLKNHLLTYKIISKFLLIFVLATAVISCKKKGQSLVVTESRSYSLLNTPASGTVIDAGKVTITKLSDGKASLSINVATAFRVPGATFKASITTISNGSEFVYSDLGNVDGTTGQGAVNLVLISNSGLAVTYADLIAKTGYTIKVLNGGTVQGVAIIN